jgi:hypothetical protein
MYKVGIVKSTYFIILLWGLNGLNM